MSLILRFNLTILLLFLLVFVIGFFKILHTTASRIQQEVSSNFELTAQMVDAQIKLLQSYPYVEVRPERKLSSFHLEQFDDITHINIELFDSNDIRIASNHSSQQPQNLLLPEAIKQWLFVAFFEPVDNISRSIDIGSMHLGKIVISPNTELELHDALLETSATLAPVMTLFLLISLGMMLVISVLIKPMLEFIGAVSHHRGQSPSSALSRIRHLIGIPEHLQGIRHELHDSSQKVTELNNKILHLQEEERRRLSAELHDELGQHLTAIRFEAEVIKTAKNLEDTQNSAESIDAIGRQMKDIVRSLLERLRPPELDMFGLQSALSEMIGNWQFRHPNITLEFEYRADLSNLDDTQQLSIYRIVQEALTNISKHAGLSALTVMISLTELEDKIKIIVSDNGQGCDLTEQVRGFGLKGIQERVEGLSGELTLISSRGNGMQITVNVPNTIRG